MKMGKLIALLALAAGCAHAPAATTPNVAQAQSVRRSEPQKVEAPPTSERARRLMDEALLAQKGAAADVVDRFKLAAEAEPQPGPATLDYAVALDRAGRVADAEKAYRAVAQQGGELGWTATERAVSLAAARGDFDAARATVAAGEKMLAAGDPSAAVLRAELELLAGNPAAAQAIARQVLAQHPDDVRATCALARAHLRQGNVGTAKLLAARAAAADAEDPEPLIVKAEIARAEHDAPAELAAARAAAEADDSSSPAALLLGRALFERGQTGEALDQLARAAELDRASFAAQLALGRALAAAGRSGEAIDALGRAAALQPQAADPHLEMARVRLDGEGNAQAALDEAKLFLRLSPHAPPAGHPIHALVQRAEEALRKPQQASVVQQK